MVFNCRLYITGTDSHICTCPHTFLRPHALSLSLSLSLSHTHTHACTHTHTYNVCEARCFKNHYHWKTDKNSWTRLLKNKANWKTKARTKSQRVLFRDMRRLWMVQVSVWGLNIIIAKDQIEKQFSKLLITQTVWD